MKRSGVACVVGWLGAMHACGKGSEPQPTPASAPLPAAVAVHDGDPAESPSVDPPALAGDLASDIETFTTIRACVDRHAHIDPIVGDALDAIGYDTILRDACRVLDAAKARDAKRCSSVDASPLRERCESMVAEIAGTPDVCPWRVDSRRALGRDPACVALASRDERLCAAVRDNAARATCTSIAKHAPSLCSGIARRADAARCARDAERWGSLIPAVKASEKPPLAVSGKLTISSDAAAAAHEWDLAEELRDGVVVTLGLDGAHVAFGPLNDADDGFVAASLHARPTPALELTVPRTRSTSSAEASGPPRLERAELQLPGRSELRAPPSRSTLAVTVTKLELSRGGSVELRVAGDLDDAQGVSRGQHIRAEMATFVRDVVTVEALYDFDVHGFGAGDEMR